MVIQAHGQSVMLCRARLTAVLAALLLSGCGSTYLMQAARGQWQMQRHRESIATLLQSAATDTTLKRRLTEVRDAREFASRALGLPDNASYTRYKAVGRPYVVWNVVAAPEFSLEPKHWCFPITGCVAYRGYFREQSARSYAMTLQRQGFDVMVGGVSAYSTLGKFSDPVLDTMMRYGELQLAGIVFHELAHQMIYVRSDSEFNESFATVVENEGIARWLDAQGRSAELQGFRRNEAGEAGVQKLMAATRVQLQSLYQQPLDDAEKRTRKQQLFQSLARSLPPGYEQWIQSGLNNAHLVASATYHDCVPAFERLLQVSGNELPRLYERVRALAHESAAARRSFCAGG
jgi:predicted aminopeptidase